jgi:predicted nuclease of restriction endonuclease-like (RecB) superfamily
LRLAANKDKQEILELAVKGQELIRAEDVVKDTYILEFLKLPEPHYSESNLEDSIIDHLEQFLLELGKGFAFVGRQYRMTIDNTNYYADLVFYHTILKRYVVIDLKIGKAKHRDIGQMNMYLGYFALSVNAEDDNPPIGIILAQNKDDVMVEFATYGMNADLFVSKYQLYLPDVDELRRFVLDNIEDVEKIKKEPKWAQDDLRNEEKKW